MTALSEFYDFYDGPEDCEEQFDFYASLFDADRCELLELGCGTGIIAIKRPFGSQSTHMNIIAEKDDTAGDASR